MKYRIHQDTDNDRHGMYLSVSVYFALVTSSGFHSIAWKHVETRGNLNEVESVENPGSLATEKCCRKSPLSY